MDDALAEFQPAKREALNEFVKRKPRVIVESEPHEIRFIKSLTIDGKTATTTTTGSRFFIDREVIEVLP